VGRRFAIVGAGKVGTALACLLSRAGYDFLGAASRTPESARAACEFAGSGRPAASAPTLTRSAELVFITTPDDAIGEVCRGLAEASGFARGSVVAHCSGALPSTILQPARSCGALLGSMHPLQSFATAEQAVQVLPGSYCCIEGDPDAVQVLSAAARAIGAHAMTIPTEGKALYHAAAVVACNFLVALEHAALKLDEAAGIDSGDAIRSLLPLIKGTVSNLENVGIPECLTGPIARGDVETTRRHVEAIGQRLPDLLPLYKVLGLETIEVALAKGSLSEERAAQLRRMLRS
jgi:predicted short-subunit dehydrogenase-like oxidoreductase (DUF2520 family)